MTGRISALRLRSLHVALLAALLLIIGGTQASADPGRTRFKIAWSACENSPQTQCGTLKVPLDWSKPSGATISAWHFLRANATKTGTSTTPRAKTSPTYGPSATKSRAGSND